MTSKAAIIKILAWRNTSPILERWDMELVRSGGTRERVVGITPGGLQRLLATAETEATRRGRSASPRTAGPRFTGKRGRPVSEILAVADVAAAAWERKVASGRIRVVSPRP
jgi:hypothetical protein